MADPTVKVSGDVKGGFIVEMHDGDRFECFTGFAKDEAAIEKSALDFWNGVKAETAAAVSVLPMSMRGMTREPSAAFMATEAAELRAMAKQMGFEGNAEPAAELNAQADKIAAEKPHG